MPITKVNEDELLDRLTDVFRTYGYEGASLSKISEATGLQRASLYHRFPGREGRHGQSCVGTRGAMAVQSRFGSTFGTRHTNTAYPQYGQ